MKSVYFLHLPCMRQLFLLLLLAAALQTNAQDDFLLARQVKTIELKLISGANECYQGITSNWLRGKCRMDYKLGESLYCELYNWGDSIFRYVFVMADSISFGRADTLLGQWDKRLYKILGNGYTREYSGGSVFDSLSRAIPNTSFGTIQYWTKYVLASVQTSPFSVRGTLLCRVSVTMQGCRCTRHRD
jgi:hypothetical protein